VTLTDLTFDNRFTAELPGDPSDLNRPRQVHHAAYSTVTPKPTAGPILLAVAAEMAAELGLTSEDVASAEFLRVVTGNLVLEGMSPHAMAYGGHQFGNWAGQLGDGRAINLGELVIPDGSRRTLQLKGAGPTPYSRSADGLAVLRSSVREFLCSEAMFHLGVTTTRALSLSLTGDEVMRDMLYDGHPALEKGAVVCRVAPSFIRFGNFEIFSSRNELDELKALTDFVIREYYSHLWPASGQPTPEIYAAWFGEVAVRTVEMIIEWQRVGFVHGVMNTDNMSILGLTIDYGPYGWLEDFDPGWTPNTTDNQHKRYRYGNQPGIGQWNLGRLANAIYPLIGDVEPLQKTIDSYVDNFEAGYRQMISNKFGLNELEVQQEPFVSELQALLEAAETDMTIFYRQLAKVPLLDDMATPEQLLEPLADAYYVPSQVTQELKDRTVRWLGEYKTIAKTQGISDSARSELMNASNPLYVLRNYLAQLAIDAADEGDYSKIAELLDALRNPHVVQDGRDHLAQTRPDWARTRAGCSMLSCSS
jgi:uncharacterized protein YdiU (UPF0061 family)